jgi:hypothetical protein
MRRPDIPYRYLPERNLARQQRDLSVERRLRFLSRRVRYPSATRTAELDLANTTTGVSAVYLSIVVDPGMWFVAAAGNVNFESGTNGEESGTLTVTAYSALTGASLGVVMQPQSRRDGGITDVRMALASFDVLHADERVRLDLTVSSGTVGAAKAVQLANLRIYAIPL